jgi:hypothetical protein
MQPEADHHDHNTDHCMNPGISLGLDYKPPTCKSVAKGLGSGLKEVIHFRYLAN